jgi:anti-sigma regulatory factor (Ser/Thr protein kinase)/ActR/RegA family two-component response regulator
MNTSLPRQVEPSRLKKALFIGADPEIHAMLQDTLDPLVWSIRHAPDNKTALAMAADMPFDLVITSENTSGRADVELLHEIRKLHPHTCVIISTDESSPADVIASMRESAFSYFSRPFSPSVFAGMVRAAIEAPCWNDGIKILQGTREWIRILARCDTQTADRLIQFVREIIDLSEPERGAVATAFREILMNAMEHGGHFRSDQYVEIGYIRSKHMMMCRVKDPGEGFTLDEVEHAAIANPIDDPVRHVTLRAERGMRPGGYGMLLTQALVDDLIYNEKGNDVLLIKYINVPPVSRVPA